MTKLLEGHKCKGQVKCGMYLDMRDFSLSQRYFWGFRSSGMWRFIIPDLSKDRVAFIWLLTLEDGDKPSNRREPLAQQHSVKSQKILVFSYSYPTNWPNRRRLIVFIQPKTFTRNAVNKTIYEVQNYMFHSQKTIINLGMKNLYKEENKI